MTHIGNVKTHYDDPNNKVSRVLTLTTKIKWYYDTRINTDTLTSEEKLMSPGVGLLA